MDARDPSPLVLDEPKAALALTDLSQLPLLAMFLRGEATVSQAAERLGTDLDEVYYRVRKLERFGILEVVSQEKRKGRPIKHYRATARAFFAPFAVLPHETFERALVESWRVFEERRAAGAARALMASFDDLHRWGFRVNVTEEAAVMAVWGPRDPGPDWDDTTLMLDADRPAVYGRNTSFLLSRDEAKTLQRELNELATRWMLRSRENRAGGGEGPMAEHLLGLSLAPE